MGLPRGVPRAGQGIGQVYLLPRLERAISAMILWPLLVDKSKFVESEVSPSEL